MKKLTAFLTFALTMLIYAINGAAFIVVLGGLAYISPAIPERAIYCLLAMFMAGLTAGAISQEIDMYKMKLWLNT